MMHTMGHKRASRETSPSRFGTLVRRVFPSLPDWMWVALGAIPQARIIYVEPEFTPARPRLRAIRQPLLPSQRVAAHIPTIPMSFTVRTRQIHG